MSDGYWRLVEPVWESINIYEGPATFLTTLADAPVTSGLLFAAHWCYSEVCNGGLSQFFANSTGVLAPEAIRGFRAIRQPAVAAILEKAVERFGPIYPRERDDRQLKLLELGKGAFDSLDAEFYETVESEAGGFEFAADVYANEARR